jgi:hypothetical protein
LIFRESTVWSSLDCLVFFYCLLSSLSHFSYFYLVILLHSYETTIFLNLNLLITLNYCIKNLKKIHPKKLQFTLSRLFSTREMCHCIRHVRHFHEQVLTTTTNNQYFNRLDFMQYLKQHQLNGCKMVCVSNIASHRQDSWW